MNEEALWSWYCAHGQCERCANSQCLHECHGGSAGVREPRHPAPSNLEDSAEMVLT